MIDSIVAMNNIFKENKYELLVIAKKPSVRDALAKIASDPTTTEASTRFTTFLMQNCGSQLRTSLARWETVQHPCSTFMSERPDEAPRPSRVASRYRKGPPYERDTKDETSMEAIEQVLQSF